MVLITENGWPQIPASELTKGFVNGLNGVQIELRRGDVYDILTSWMIWYDRNVEDIERNFNNGQRDEWGWSATNSVWNSNHLSGTAIDINATQWPMGSRRMPAEKVAAVEEGLRLFEGRVFWGRVWNTPDEMHYQIQGNAQQIAPLAQKLREGYLNLLAPEKPRDPTDFPLPQGYAYGPLDGPIWCISGEWHGDSQEAKDGLGRWQEAVNIPVTKKWDATTKSIATQLQLEKGWPETPNLGRGLIYEGEWTAVMKEGWRPQEGSEPFGVYWADTSQYQGRPVNSDYEFPVYSFRVCTGNQVDTLAVENYRAARQLAEAGRIKAIIPYGFFRPREQGHDTFGTVRVFFENEGKHPLLCPMIDVESGNGSALGSVPNKDHSAEINAGLEWWVNELVDGDKRAVLGYHNFVADPGLWRSLPNWLKVIRPNYSLQPGKGVPAGPQFFAHQFTSTGRAKPWPAGVDLNFFAGTLTQFLEAVGIKDVAPPPPPPPGGNKFISLAEGESVMVIADGD